jgi:hypothetical protein
MQPTPYIDEHGKRFYNARQAAQIVGTITAATLWSWAKKGKTPEPYSIDLGIIRQPVIHHRHRKSNEAPPMQPRAYRMLIPEEKVFALKEMFRGHDRHRGSFRKDEMAEFAARAYRLRSPQPLASHV